MLGRSLLAVLDWLQANVENPAEVLLALSLVFRGKTVLISLSLSLALSLSLSVSVAAGCLCLLRRNLRSRRIRVDPSDINKNTPPREYNSNLSNMS